jgi:hypothetical protein
MDLIVNRIKNEKKNSNPILRINTKSNNKNIENIQKLEKFSRALLPRKIFNNTKK